MSTPATDPANIAYRTEVHAQILAACLDTAVDIVRIVQNRFVNNPYEASIDEIERASAICDRTARTIRRTVILEQRLLAGALAQPARTPAAPAPRPAPELAPRPTPGAAPSPIPAPERLDRLDNPDPVEDLEEDDILSDGIADELAEDLADLACPSPTPASPQPASPQPAPLPPRPAQAHKPSPQPAPDVPLLDPRDVALALALARQPAPPRTLSRTLAAPAQGRAAPSKPPRRPQPH